jgi:hypothetical protein
VIVAALTPRVHELMHDIHANHVIQRCVATLTNGRNGFVLDAVSRSFVKVGSHRHGCCVLQRCLDNSSGEARDKLIGLVIEHTPELIADQYGNYVVQYVLQLREAELTKAVVRAIQGTVAELACEKFSSNVVEKCLTAAVRACLLRACATALGLGSPRCAAVSAASRSSSRMRRRSVAREKLRPTICVFTSSSVSGRCSVSGYLRSSAWRTRKRSVSVKGPGPTEIGSAGTPLGPGSGHSKTMRRICPARLETSTLCGGGSTVSEMFCLCSSRETSREPSTESRTGVCTSGSVIAPTAGRAPTAVSDDSTLLATSPTPHVQLHSPSASGKRLLGRVARGAARGARAAIARTALSVRAGCLGGHIVA